MPTTSSTLGTALHYEVRTTGPDLLPCEDSRITFDDEPQELFLDARDTLRPALDERATV